jgi:hypothetical protein
MQSPQKHRHRQEGFSMNRVTQEAKSRQAAVVRAGKRGKSCAAQKCGAILSSVKRWRKRYNGT